MAQNVNSIASLDFNQHINKRWGGVKSTALSYTLANFSNNGSRFLLVVTPDSQTAIQYEHEISFFLGQRSHQLLHLPDWETLPYDIFSPHAEIISQRLKTLHQLVSAKHGILVLPVSTLLQKLLPRQYVEAHSLSLQKGQTIKPADLKSNLVESGYQAVNQVHTHGEFSARGSLLDLFPMGANEPIRIDWFDDEIDSISIFDVESQKSAGKIDQIELLPAHEFPFNDASIKSFRQKYREVFEGDPTKSQIYAAISQNKMVGGIEYYLPLFHEKLESIFDYLPDNTVLCKTPELIEDCEEYFQNIEHRYEQRRHNTERPILEPQEIFHTSAEITEKIAALDSVTLQNFSCLPEQDGINLEFQMLSDISLQIRQEEPAKNLLSFLHDTSDKIVFAAESTGRREHILDTLRPFGITPKPVNDWHGVLSSDEKMLITIANLDESLVIPGDELVVITEHKLLAQKVKQRQRRKRRATQDAASIIKNLADLSIGAPVVHEDHGVGRYLGLQYLDAGGIKAEYLTLQYADNDKLYVPISSLQLISRYTGADADNAPTHRLGTETWSKVKKKAAMKAHDVAAELLEVQAKRAARIGYAHPMPEEYPEFANSFPFEETEDQQSAIEAVIEDLLAVQPMDRVICGDVGFGKTEVALRAAFVAASSSKQVAVLVPTTLLAQQHGKTFKDRFSDWPIRVDVLSRFKTAKEQKQTLAELEAGTVDIVIGTHKLLSKDIKFKDLGLVIIDEEQRFGVRHKEKLKALRSEVDILTLTATPIPRTLNMSLAGLRDLSIIATAPQHRHPVKTFVSEWNQETIQEACLREIKRGGQVYFLHNEVKTINKTARDLEALIPEAKVQVAHGQMTEGELENVMLDFYHMRFNILVCTTIIETGIDHPSANTIVIERADKFGLAQLHQLRGRVGRSHHLAYAYLITPPTKLMTTDAVKRLEAIESLEELGAGFSLATHDLEIRGAGELLGSEQSGQIHEIGFNLYNDLLSRSVAALKRGEIPQLDRKDDPSHTEVDLGVAALLPDDYIFDVHTRLVLYKRIASAADSSALDELQVELIDRFGLLPDAAKNLFGITQLKLRCVDLGVKQINTHTHSGYLVFTETPKINVANLLKLIQQQTETFTLKGQEKLMFILDDFDAKKTMSWLNDLLDTLAEK